MIDAFLQMTGRYLPVNKSCKSYHKVFLPTTPLLQLAAIVSCISPALIATFRFRLGCNADQQHIEGISPEAILKAFTIL